MEERKLPNATISLVLGIISYVACCFSWGIGGIVLSGIALFLANKDKKTYLDNPEAYDNYKQVNTARIVAIIGLVLGVLTLAAMAVVLITYGGYDAFMEAMQEMKQQMEDAQGR